MRVSLKCTLARAAMIIHLLQNILDKERFFSKHLTFHRLKLGVDCKMPFDQIVVSALTEGGQEVERRLDILPDYAIHSTGRVNIDNDPRRSDCAFRQSSALNSCAVTSTLVAANLCGLHRLECDTSMRDLVRKPTHRMTRKALSQQWSIMGQQELDNMIPAFMDVLVNRHHMERGSHLELIAVWEALIGGAAQTHFSTVRTTKCNTCGHRNVWNERAKTVGCFRFDDVLISRLLLSDEGVVNSRRTVQDMINRFFQPFSCTTTENCRSCRQADVVQQSILLSRPPHRLVFDGSAGVTDWKGEDYLNEIEFKALDANFEAMTARYRPIILFSGQPWHYVVLTCLPSVAYSSTTWRRFDAMQRGLWTPVDDITMKKQVVKMGIFEKIHDEI